VNRSKPISFFWKPLVFFICLTPFLIITSNSFGLLGDLGVNQVETLIDHFGNWALRFIVIALAVSPLRKITKWSWLSRYRRMIGLFAFFYAFMHFLIWTVLEKELNLNNIIEDIIERPFILLGFIAVFLLASLAITSFVRIRIYMKGYWQLLHNMIYVIGILSVWHYWWQVKKDITEPLIYALIIFILLFIRIAYYQKNKAMSQTKD